MTVSNETGLSHEQITVAATAVGVTMPVGRTPVRATLTLETAQIRFTYHGTAPSAAVGHLMDVGDALTLEGAVNITNFRAIRSGSTSGVLSVTLETL